MDPIVALAGRHGIQVIEDAAQSFGGQYKGRRLGTIGNIGIYSFQLHKMITAGEGGAVVTNDPLAYERAVRFHVDQLNRWRSAGGRALEFLHFPARMF
jgi:8-amino-3,8-dideoxy-alpha-D-manno-octulosonate transaminase